MPRPRGRFGQGGARRDAAVAAPHEEALQRGLANLAAHLDVVRAFGLPCVVSLNRFPTDTDREVAAVRELAEGLGAGSVVVNDGFARGGPGGVELAEAVLEACEGDNGFAPVNPPGLALTEQIERIATRLYGAEGVDYLPAARRKLDRLTAQGLGDLPVCMAKTHMSISHDPFQKGRPTGYRLPVRDLLPSVGAGFVVALCGDIMLMPGLGRNSAFAKVDIDEEGRTIGLF